MEQQPFIRYQLLAKLEEFLIYHEKYSSILTDYQNQYKKFLDKEDADILKEILKDFRG